MLVLLCLSFGFAALPARLTLQCCWGSCLNMQTNVPKVMDPAQGDEGHLAGMASQPDPCCDERRPAATLVVILVRGCWASDRRRSGPRCASARAPPQPAAAAAAAAAGACAAAGTPAGHSASSCQPAPRNTVSITPIHKAGPVAAAWAAEWGRHVAGARWRRCGPGAMLEATRAMALAKEGVHELVADRQAAQGLSAAASLLQPPGCCQQEQQRRSQPTRRRRWMRLRA